MPVHPVSADCVWCYRFDEENATDNAVAAGGSWGKTLTQTGSPPVQDPAVWNKGRYFGAAGRYLDWGHTAWNAPGLDNPRMTIAGWLYWDGTLPANQSVLVQHWSEWYGWTEELRVWLDSSGFINFYVCGPFSIAFPIKAQLTSGIHHFVATVIGGTPQARQSIYIDGVRVHYSELNQNGCRIISQGFAHIRIGGNAQDPTNTYWRGWLDDWAIYTTEKDQAWVSTYADATSPIITPISPTSGATEVTTTSSLSINITDNHQINISSTSIKINGGDYSNATIWTSDSATGTFTGTRSSITDGYNYLLNHSIPFDYNTTYTISVDAYDNALNNTHLDYNFSSIDDSTAPIITPISPSDGEIDFYPILPIDLNITDSESGVNYLLTTIKLNGGGYSNTIIWSGDAPAGGFAGTRSSVSDGYKYLLTNNSAYLPNTIYSILVDAYDYANNRAFLSYSFTSAPSIIIYENETPINISTGIATNSSISVDILTGSETIIPNNIKAYVNGDIAFNGSFVYPFSGTLSPTVVDGYDGYHLIINNSIDYNNSLWVSTNINTEDYYGFISTTNWKFYTQTKLLQVIQYPYDITLEAEFSGPITIASDISNISNYSLSQPAYIRKIDVISSTVLRFWVEYFFGVSEFTFECLDSIQDNYGNNVITEAVTIVPFSSSANIGQGLLRTGHDENFILSDSQRIYIAGTKGIDVFKKGQGIAAAPWAQIFDEYGVDALCVVNYPQDIIITDTVSPYISYNNPLNGSSATPDVHVVLVIADLTTSVDINSLRIYINGVSVFSGGEFGGFTNGFTGYISITYKSLGIEFWPEIEFSNGELITVRVIAEDLLSNTMDQSYYFTISESVFGIGYWGFIPFGV